MRHLNALVVLGATSQDADHLRNDPRLCGGAGATERGDDERYEQVQHGHEGVQVLQVVLERVVHLIILTLLLRLTLQHCQLSHTLSHHQDGVQAP